MYWNKYKDFHDWMIKHNYTIALAESVTVGKLTSECAVVPGASQYLKGGIVAYNLEQKVNLLGVRREIAEPCNCVSEVVALDMARGATEKMDADIGVATTGYAGGVDASYAWMAIYIRPLDMTYSIRLDPGVIIGICCDTRVAYQDEIARMAYAKMVDWLLLLQ